VACKFYGGQRQEPRRYRAERDGSCTVLGRLGSRAWAASTHGVGLRPWTEAAGGLHGCHRITGNRGPNPAALLAGQVDQLRELACARSSGRFGVVIMPQIGRHSTSVRN